MKVIGVDLIYIERYFYQCRNDKFVFAFRNDGGRYSMRATSTTNKSSTSTQSKPSSAKSTPGSAGVKKPTTRGHSSNSLLARAEREKEAEKEKEKAAWDRRRTYDPRKAVQQVGHTIII